MTEEPLELRLQLLRHGWEPLPVLKKAVYLDDWQSRSIDAAEISKWSRKKPRWRSTGIRCGNVIGIDLDIDNEELIEGISKLVQKVLGETPLIRVGRPPRRMLVYRADQPSTRKMSLKLDDNQGQVEILASGQQFVAFGIHPGTRKNYQWVGDSTPLDLPPDQLPVVTEARLNQLLDRLKTHLDGLGIQSIIRGATASVTPVISSAPYELDYLAAALEYLEADEYDLWVEVGMALHYETQGSPEGLVLWDQWSRKSGKHEHGVCERKWSSFGIKENSKTGASIIYRAKDCGFDPQAYPGSQRDYSGDLIDQSQANVVRLPSKPKEALTRPGAEEFPRHLLNPPGLVGLVADLTYKMGHRDQPLFGICAGLTTVAAASLNWFIVDDWKTPLNLYLMVIAETGEGKEAPRKAIKKALELIERHDQITEAVASGPALLRAISRGPQRSCLLLQDEIGRLLSVAAKPSNGHQYELISEIIRLYGLADSTHAGKVYANKSDNISPLRRPFLNLFGTTTRRSLVDALSNRDVLDGHLNRLLVVPVEGKSKYKEPAIDVTPELRDGLKALRGVDAMDFYYLEDDPPETIPIPVTTDAKETLILFRDLADDRRLENKPTSPLWARAFENAIRVAGVLAVGVAACERNLVDEPPIVDGPLAQWAVDFTSWSVERAVRLAECEVADNEFHRVVKRMREAIAQHCRQSDVGLMSRSELTRKFQNVENRVRHQAIQTLVDSGDIQGVSINGDRTTYYRPTAP